MEHLLAFARAWLDGEWSRLLSEPEELARHHQ